MPGRPPRERVEVAARLHQGNVVPRGALSEKADKTRLQKRRVARGREAVLCAHGREPARQPGKRPALWPAVVHHVDRRPNIDRRKLLPARANHDERPASPRKRFRDPLQHRLPCDHRRGLVRAEACALAPCKDEAGQVSVAVHALMVGPVVAAGKRAGRAIQTAPRRSPYWRWKYSRNSGLSAAAHASALSAYQRTVRASPSSKRTAGDQPRLRRRLLLRA